MKTLLEYRIRSLAFGLSCATFFQYVAPPARAQEPPAPLSINIVVVEGEGATNSAHERAKHDPVVRIEDENHKPIAGAVVVFTLPTEGTTGVFVNGSQTLIMMTESNGQAAAKGLRVNQVTGKLTIHVTASYRGLSARTTINQLNEGVPGAKYSKGGGSTKLLVILAVVGAAAGGGAYFATHKGGSSSISTTTPPPPVGIGLTPGTGTIIGPH